MKKLIVVKRIRKLITSSVIVILLMASFAFLIESKDVEKEREAIKKVIEENTRCYYEADFESYQELFVDRDYTLRAWNNADGSYGVFVGYDSIMNNARQGFANRASLQMNHLPKVEYLDYKFRFYGNSGAFVTWIQRLYGEDGNYGDSRGIRFMEKEDGQWKIAALMTYMGERKP